MRRAWLTALVMIVGVVVPSTPSWAVIVPAGVATWGDGSQGQMGDGTWENATDPVFPLSGLGTVTEVTAGWRHACAVVDGAAYCWGINEVGNLGNGTKTNSNVPTAVIGLEGKTVTAVSAGVAHSCALADGLAYCWGADDSYRLGNGSNSGISFTTAQPVNMTGVLAGKTITDISAGDQHTCAVASGKAYCWGWAGEGRLGNGSMSGQTDITAVDDSGVLAGKTVTDIEARGAQTCAIADSKLYCWGQGASGTLGNGLFVDSSVPVAVLGPIASKTVTSVSISTRPNAVPYVGSHACAIADGKAYCWGEGSEGQLGNSQSADTSIPAAVTTASDLGAAPVTSIATGGKHSCAVAGGHLSCWGEDIAGKWGASSNVPRVVFDDPVTVTTVTVGTDFAAASLASGSKPAAVQGLSAQGAWHSVVLAWDAPADPGSPAGTRYEVDLMSNGAWQRHTTTTARTLALDDLQPGQTVRARVRLRNGYGIGPWSDTIGAADPLRIPEAVREAVAEPDAGRVTFTWTPPLNAQSAGVGSYRVYAESDGPCENCGASVDLNGAQLSFTVSGLDEAQSVTLDISAVGRDGYGPAVKVSGTTPTWTDTGRGEVAISVASTKSYRGAGVRVRASSWEIWALGTRTERRGAGCDKEVTFTPRGSTRPRSYDFCHTAVLDPPRSGTFAASFRSVQRSVPIRVIQGTKRYRLYNARQVSGSVKKGSPIVRSRMYVKQKFTDGKWVRIRQRPWIEYRPLSGGQWRRVANKAVRPGWYRIANNDVYWPPKKITEVRIPSVAPFNGVRYYFVPQQYHYRAVRFTRNGRRLQVAWIGDGPGGCFVGQYRAGAYYGTMHDFATPSVYQDSLRAGEVTRGGSAYKPPQWLVDMVWRYWRGPCS